MKVWIATYGDDYEEQHIVGIFTDPTLAIGELVKAKDGELPGSDWKWDHVLITPYTIDQAGQDGPEIVIP